MTAPASERGCSGDGCHSAAAGGLWPLHHVRHRGILRRFCTSCVLKSHPGSFCSACFDVLDGSFAPSPAISPGDASRPAVVHCSKCPSVVHLACLTPVFAHDFICPSCRNSDDFSYFPFSGAKELCKAKKLGPLEEFERESDGIRQKILDSASVQILLAAKEEPKTKKEGALDASDGELDGMGQREIDLVSAKVLLAGAKLAAASMSKAAAVAKSEAERKVKEAALARKRARETLERAISVCKKERERAKDTKGAVHGVADLKKKATRPSGAVAMALVVQKRAQNRERKKWMRFNEPMLMVQGPALDMAGNGKTKGNVAAAVQKILQLESKDRVGSLSKLQNHERREEGKKGLLVSSQSGNVEEEERGLTVAADNGPRILHAIQDASISKIPQTAILAGSANDASLHS